MENKKKKGDSVFTCFFLVLLFLFSVANANAGGVKIVKDSFRKSMDNGISKESLLAVEEEINERLFLRYPMIEGYGLLQNLMGKKEENAFTNVKSKNGTLYTGNFWNGFGEDQKELAIRIRRLHDQLSLKDTQVGMVFFPMKVAERNNSYYGIPYSDATEIAEELSSWLRYYNVPELDLTDIKNFSGLTEQEAFFRTDQHWTPNLAFEGYREILEWLGKEFGAEIESKKQFSDINNYKKVTLKNVMLGSQGREAGLFFSGGTEDITVIYPEAKTRYTLKRGRLEEYETIEGTFEQALLNFADIENEDIYSGGAERIYLHNGIDEFVSISNHDTTSKEKILILRDSFATPIGAFLAQSFQQTDMLWSESIEEDELADFLAENHYDYVLVMLYPENLDSKSFPFGMEKTP